MTTNPTFPLSQHGYRAIRLLGLDNGSSSKNLRYVTKIVELANKPKYSALSYCWGAAVADTSQKTITIDKVLTKVRPTLYSFLKEMAIDNTGIWMWIDYICIDQNNKEERSQQVSIMADIFRSAESVYVWLGRGDDDTSYAIEHIRDYNPCTGFVQTTFSECVEKLFTASYWTRRWVIQEFTLAEKLVVACGKQQTTWDQVTKKINKSVLPEHSTAWSTFQMFKDVRDTNKRRGLSLLQLMGKFQHSRCVEVRDKAFALRGIATDGQRLAVEYSESVGDLYFRILSILPTEWILPKMTGYRWPHQAAKDLSPFMGLTKDHLLNSLLDSTDDLLFTVFEYVGTVVKVGDCSCLQNGEDGCGAFFLCPRQVQIQASTRRHLYGRRPFKVGNVVYSLRSTSQSPKGLYIALASNRVDQSVVGLLLDEPHNKGIAYWQGMQLTEQKMRLIEDTLLHGVTRCITNVSAEHSCRVLCHISRKVFVLLWLLDIGQIQHLCDRLSTPEAEESLCHCLQRSIDTSSSSQLNKAFLSCNLEIMPNLPTSKIDDQWKAASMQLWSMSASPPLLQDQESHENVWQIPDAVDFRAHGVTQLCRAAREGLSAFATYLLSQLAVSTSTNADANQRTSPSSHEDNLSEVEEPLFYAHKVDLNGADDDGRTELWWAVTNGHETVARLLLKNGKFKPDVTDILGRAPLSWAAERGHEAVVKLLVERDDVKADLTDRDGRTPLSWAAAGGHEAVVKLLVERDNVKADLTDRDGRTPLSWAAERGHEAVVKLLVERDDVKADSTDERGWTPLSCAAARGHEAVVKLLVERADVKVDRTDRDGWTPLSWAAARGHEAVVKLLVERDDVKADSTDRDGRTPLSWAAEGGHEAVVKLLVERDDVEADLTDRGGRTPLSWAAAGGHEAVVKLLRLKHS